MHEYTIDEKHEQLKVFASTVQDALSILKSNPDAAFIDSSNLEYLHELANKQLNEEIKQELLTNLATKLVPAINKHKEWEPPFPNDKSGKIQKPEWYCNFEYLHESLHIQAIKLRALGCY